MSDKIKQSKLGTGLLHGEIAQTITEPKRAKLKFTDYAIERYNADFIGKNGKTKSRVYIPFEVSKHSSLKGLKLWNELINYM